MSLVWKVRTMLCKGKCKISWHTISLTLHKYSLEVCLLVCARVCVCKPVCLCAVHAHNLAVCIVQGRDQGLNVIGLDAGDVDRHCWTVGIGCVPRSETLTSEDTHMQTTAMETACSRQTGWLVNDRWPSCRLHYCPTVFALMWAASKFKLWL